MGNDSDSMSCSEFQDAISAIVDDEQPGIDRLVVEAHIAGCMNCAAYQRTSVDMSRRFGLRSVDPRDVSRPDDVGHIAPLAAIADRAASWRAPRVLLFVVAVEVFVLSAIDMVSASGDASEMHDARHLSAFTLAYGVLLLVVVIRPARARTALPVAAVLAVALAITAIADLVAGRVPLSGEALHLPEVLSVLLIFLLAVPGPRRRARQQARNRVDPELTVKRG